MNQVWEVWHSWGALGSLIITVAIAATIFYRAQVEGRQATLPKILGVVAPILILPSALFRFLPAFEQEMGDAVTLLNAVGLGALLLALLALGLYIANLPREEVIKGMPAPSFPAPPYQAPYPNTTSFPPTPPLPASRVPVPAVAPTVAAAQGEAGGNSWHAPSAATMVLRREPVAVAWLVYKSGIHMGQVLPLKDGAVIGSDAMVADVALDDPGVSKQHAKVRLREGEGFVVIDMASTNGTFVRDPQTGRWEALTGHYLMKDRDELKFGDTELAFMQIQQGARHVSS